MYLTGERDLECVHRHMPRLHQDKSNSSSSSVWCSTWLFYEHYSENKSSRGDIPPLTFDTVSSAQVKRSLFVMATCLYPHCYPHCYVVRERLINYLLSCQWGSRCTENNMNGRFAEKKVAIRFVPHLLTEERWEQRVIHCEDLLSLIEPEENILDKINYYKCGELVLRW